MLSKVSVAALLKSVVGLACLIVVTIVAVNVWSSWQRLGERRRVLAIADASGHAFRTDEIVALAGALGTFKQNAADKARIEGEQADRHAQTATRQKAVEQHIAAFEAQMREALEALGSASGQMRQTSDGMSATSEQTNRQVKMVATASADASSNVQTVAAASEELNASIAEISRQVAHAATIAGRAVEETHQTDTTVQSLTETAARIGEVVKLINDIAAQPTCSPSTPPSRRRARARRARASRSSLRK
jgi:methyl-accepting chemotaxis protein